MSQQDFNITTADANTGVTMRAAINAALQALASMSSGASAPATTYPFQFWADTTNDLLKMRNEANDDWIELMSMSDARPVYIPSSVSSTELGYLDGVTSLIQSQINAKQATITGAATSIVSSNLTANRVLASDASGKVGVSGVTSSVLAVLDGLIASTAELNYTDGVTSNIQNQLNAKQAILVSGVNIKTINSASLLGGGNMAMQPTLVSGTNIKTINGTSLLGSGNVSIAGGVTSLNGQSGAITNTNFQAIGSYAVAFRASDAPYNSGAGTWFTSINSTYAGSGLRYNTSDYPHLKASTSGGSVRSDFGSLHRSSRYWNSGGSSLSGTWRCIARAGALNYYPTGYYWTSGLFVRIA